MHITNGQSSLGTESRRALIQHARNVFLLFRLFSPLVLVVPAGVVVLVVVLARTPMLWPAEKSTQELVAPAIMAIAVVVAALYWARAGDFVSRWLLLLCVSLFCRELHFVGTDNGIYVAFAVLVWHAARNIAEMSAFTENRVNASLFAGALVTYGLSKTFDRGYWSSLRPWPNWQDAMEESLESAAHLLMLGLVVTSYVVFGAATRRGDSAATPFLVRVRRWGLTAAAVAAGLYLVSNYKHEAARPPRRGGEFPVELSSLCNVSPELGLNLFLAGSDEDRKLTLWTLDDDRAVFVKKIALGVPQPNGSSLHLADLEDLAWDGRDTYYAVGSHRHLLSREDRARATKSRGTECALISFRLQRTDDGLATVDAQVVTHDLLAKIYELGAFQSIDWGRSKVFSWRGLAETWQLDIEGLACVDGKLLLGFKNPVEQGRAAILRFDPASGELAVAARPDLAGHGILGLHYDATRDRLLLLSNEPLKHRYADSNLWVGTRGGSADAWEFSAARKIVVEPRRPKNLRKASGVTVAGAKLAICFDSETESPIRLLAPDDGLLRR